MNRPICEDYTFLSFIVTAHMIYDVNTVIIQPVV